MDADRKQELAEVKRAIKTAEARLQMHEESKNLEMAMKIQDEINKLRDKELFLMKQQGESQPPCQAAKFVYAWRNSNFPKKSWTS
jgi:hypothetical protein